MFYGLHKVHTLAFHQELEHIPRLATSKTLEEALVRNNVKAWSAFLMERAIRLEFLAGFLQRYKFANDINNVGAGADFFDYFIGNHGSPPNITIVTPAPPS